MQPSSGDSSGLRCDTKGGACSSLEMLLGMHVGTSSDTPASTSAPPTSSTLDTEVEFLSGVPELAETILERLHPNIFASLAQIRLRDDTHDLRGVITYVWRDKRDTGAVLNLLMLARRQREVLVLNEGIQLTREQLGKLAADVFRTWPDASAITLHASLIDTEGLTYPSQCHVCSEDIVLTLPSSFEAYEASLGKSTRSYLHRYLGKLKRSFPGLAHRVMYRDEIDEQMMLDLIAMNRKRMEGKGKISILDDAATQRIITLARQYGMLNVLTIDGKVCAGTINYGIGGHYFLDVIAHDPAYNDYRAGTLGCYLTICECIARGGREYHFLWGQSDYKFRLGGVQRDLMHATIYRSRLHMLAHSKIVMRNALAFSKRRARLRLAQDDKFARAARRLIQVLKP